LVLTRFIRIALGSTGLLAMTAAGAAAPGFTEVLANLPAKAPVRATVDLESWAQHTLKKQTVTGQAEVAVEAEEDPEGLRIVWPDRMFRNVDAEAQTHDRDHGLPTPTRDAVKELDPGRVRHLLDQSGTLRGLVREATLLEEKPDTLDGRPVRLRTYQFIPRLSWSEEYHLQHREARLKLWLDGEGLPVASESSVTYDGKTSRMFGRYVGSTTVQTRYQHVGDRILVASRETRTFHSVDDGAEEERSRQVFRIIVH